MKHPVLQASLPYPDKALSLLQNDSDKKAFYSMMGLAESLNQVELPVQLKKRLREKWTNQAWQALSNHLQGLRSMQKEAVFSDLEKLGTKAKVRYISAILFPSPAFMRKKYKTKNRFLVMGLYPYHTVRKRGKKMGLPL